ncbi:MAG: ATP-grasp domain-containing protein [Patescibacteria group bacterium]
MQSRDLELKKGAFVLSLDFELAWGTRGADHLKNDYLNTRQAITRLLELFVKYDIKATWATVGHLFLDSCNNHPEIFAPANWFDIDPHSNIQSDPIWYGKDIIDRILSCPVKQEIGCHTFSHVIADDPACTPEWFRSELIACKNLASSRGLELRSFVYPKNHVAHTSILKEQGIEVFRAPDENWYAGLSGILKRLAHVLDNYLVFPVRSVSPKQQDGLTSIPGSYFYPHARGWAKYLPVSFRVSKVLLGIDRAVKEKKVFHLWFHPFNLASNPDELLRGLDQIFARVAELKRQGLMDQVVMGEIGQLATARQSVMVLDGSVQSALAIVRSLGSKDIRVICGAERKTGMALHSRYCTQSFVYPSPITDPEGFIKAIKQVYDDNGGNMMVLSCSDATFLPLSKNRNLFTGLEKILPTPESVEVAFDKSKTLELAQRLGIAIPGTKKPESREQAEAAGVEVNFPCILKPRHSCQWKNGRGASGRTITIQNAQELGEKAQEIADKTGEWPLIQRYVQGEEFGAFFLMQNGEVKSEFAHRRVRSISPYGGASCVRESIEMPADMRKASLDLLKALDWTGVAMVEFKRDAFGKLVLMEINGRFWGSLPLAIHSGVDFPALLLGMAQGHNVVASGYRKGVTSRHLLADVKHLTSVWFGGKISGLPQPSKWVSLKDFIFDFFRSESKGDIFSWVDLKPALVEPFDVMQRGKSTETGYKGVMHVHSAYSYDAKLDLEQLKSIFKSRGVSFVCLTEHIENFAQDKVQEYIRRCHEQSDPDFVFIPGFEVPCNGQHVMLINVTDLDLNLSPLEMIETAKKDGALVVLAHPHRNKFTTGQFGALLDGIEIWNAHYDGKYAPRTKAIKLLDTLRKSDPELKAFAGLDMHRKEHLGGPSIKVNAANLNPGAILSALKQGEYVLSKNKLSLDSLGRAKGFWRVWASVVSPVSIVLVTSFKRLSRSLRQSNIKPPEKLKAWLRKWL